MTLVPARLAATVMMVRDDPFQVLMVRRNAREPFASAFVFPGGVVDPEDYAAAWLPLCGGTVDLDADQRALRVAACRESWEEVGLLPCSPHEPTVGEPSFLRYAVKHQIHLALDELVTFAHWITPEFAPKRFDTYFFICPVRHAERASCDGHETVSLEWVEPLQALASDARGERPLLLPTRENLKLLSQSEDSAGAIAAARRRPVVTIMPRWRNGQPSLQYS